MLGVEQVFGVRSYRRGRALWRIAAILPAPGYSVKFRSTYIFPSFDFSMVPTLVTVRGLNPVAEGLVAIRRPQPASRQPLADRHTSGVQG